MWNTVKYEGFGGLPESNAFIESTGIFLCLNVDALCIEMLYSGINGMKHNLFAITLVSFCRDDPSNRDFLHVSSCWANASQSHHFISYSQPHVYSLLVVTIHVLIDTVLLDHKHLAAHSQEFIQLVHGQLVKRFLM